MTKAAKRTLFFGAIALFLVLSPIIIFYAQGYKYSFSDGRFYSTGTVALKVNTGANVYLDNEFMGDTSFLGNAFSIDGLLPGKYEIFIQKDNFSSWRKEVEIKENLLTDFSKILILPLVGKERDELILEIEEIFSKQAETMPVPTPTPSPTPRSRTSPSPTVTPFYEDPFVLEKDILYHNTSGVLVELATNVVGILPSFNKDKVAYWTNNGVWVIWISDQNYQPIHKKGDRELIANFELPINGLAWFRGEDHLVVRFSDTSYKYSVTEIDTRGGVNAVVF